ncbi:MAG: ATP-binding cassette domain-containing protein [Ignavibacteriaceae bacterium]|nr:ATP-binding cassette domain-containing protein [Ignavibacteriaceae bacterium]
MIQINIKSVCLFEQAGKRILLRNVAFAMEEQNIYTILGKNGEGKSTLLKSVTNLLDENVFSSEGSVEFEGVDLLLLSQNRLAEFRKAKIQYVLQDPVNSFDPLKKIGYYFNLYSFEENEIKKEFDFFNLPEPTKIFQLYPYEVSGGMAQRIALILALLKKPKFLLLDEPTSGIDNETIFLTKERLKKFVLQNNAAILVITQDLSFAENFTDFISYLDGGNLSEFVSFKDFFDVESGSIKNFLNAYKQLNSETVINR